MCTLQGQSLPSTQSVGRGGRWNLRDLVDLLWACARLDLAPDVAAPLAARILELLPTGERLVLQCASMLMTCISWHLVYLLWACACLDHAPDVNPPLAVCILELLPTGETHRPADVLSSAALHTPDCCPEREQSHLLCCLSAPHPPVLSHVCLL